MEAAERTARQKEQAEKGQNRADERRSEGGAGDLLVVWLGIW